MKTPILQQRTKKTLQNWEIENKLIFTSDLQQSNIKKVKWKTNTYKLCLQNSKKNFIFVFYLTACNKLGKQKDQNKPKK